MLYISEATVSLVSQGQIHRQGHRLKLIPEGIALGDSDIVAKLTGNNFYLIHLMKPFAKASQSNTALAAINGKTVQMWHSCLGHLGEQNIHRLVTISEGINLTKPPSKDTCAPCTIASLHTEPHKSSIEPGKHFLELVHNDVIGPMETAYTGARYAVTFLNNFHKSSVVYFLIQKSEVIKAAQQYCLHYERGDNRIWRLRTDWGGEYDSLEWDRFQKEKGINWEPTVPGNPEMNGTSERLGQTLHRKASTMLKESGLSIRYWPKLMNTTNYLRNRSPVTGRDVTPYEANMGQKPQLGHL